MIAEFQNALTIEKFARSVGVHPASAHRWRLLGVIDRATGERIKLRALRVGGTYRIRPDDAAAFIARLNSAPTRPAINSTDRANAAAAELERLGA